MYLNQFYNSLSKLIVFFLLIWVLPLNAQLRKSFTDEKEWRWSYKVRKLADEAKYDLGSIYMDSILNITDTPDPFLYKDAAEVYYHTRRFDRLLTILQMAKRDSFCGVWKDEYASLIPDIPNDLKMDCTPEIIENFELSNELVTMLVQDQDCRGLVPQVLTDKLKALGYLFKIDPMHCIEKGTGFIDSLHTIRVKEIIDSIGDFPSKNLVGKYGVQALEIIIIHSSDYTFKENMLPFFKRNFEKGISDAQNYIILFDKIYRKKTGKTLFGTQAYPTQYGYNKFYEIEDIDSLSPRRMQLGIMPIDYYAKALNAKF